MEKIKVVGGVNRRMQEIQFENLRQFRKRCCEEFQISYDCGILIDIISNNVISLNGNISFSEFNKFTLEFCSAQDILQIYKDKFKNITEEKNKEIETLKTESESKSQTDQDNFAKQLQEKENKYLELEQKMSDKIKELQELEEQSRNKLGSEIQTLKEQKQQLEIQFQENMANSTQHYENVIQEKLEEIQKITNAYNQLVPEYQQNYNLLQTYQAGLQQMEIEKGQYENQIYNLTEEKEDLEKKLKKKLKALDEECFQLNQENQSFKSQVDIKTQEIAKLKKKLKKEKEDHQKAIEEMNQDEEVKKEIEKYKEQNKKQKAEITELKDKVAQMTQELQKMEINIRTLDKEKNNQISENEQLTLQQKNVQQNLEEVNKNCKAQKQEIKQKETEIANLKKQIEDLNRQLNDQRNTLNEKDKELMNLQKKHQEISNQEQQKGLDIISKNRENQTINEQLQKQKTKNQELTTENNKNVAKVVELTAERNKLDNENKQQKAQIEALRKQIELQIEHLKKEKSEFDDVNARLQELKSRLHAVSISKVADQNIQSLIEEVNSKLNGVKISEFEKDQNANNDDNKQLVVFEIECNEKLLKEHIEQGQLYNLHKTCLKAKELGAYRVRRTLNKMGENDLQEIFLFQVLEKTNAAQIDLVKKSFGLVKNKKIDCIKSTPEDATQLTTNNFICQYYLKCYIEALKDKKINIPKDFHMERQYIVKDQDGRFYFAEMLNDSKITKYLGGSKPLDKTVESQFMVGFSYYTYVKSQNELLVSYLQTADTVLCDPFICTKDGILSQVDLGSNEINKIVEKIEADRKLAGPFFDAIQPLLK